MFVNMDRFLATLTRPLLILLAFSSGAAYSNENESESHIRIHEINLRSFVVNINHPKFPDSLLSPSKSVAVAEITFDSGGMPREINILEAATPEISKSMSDALSSWRLAPSNRSQQGNKVIITSKVTYYFIAEAENREVHGPEWNGNFNRWNDYKTQGNIK